MSIIDTIRNVFTPSKDKSQPQQPVSKVTPLVRPTPTEAQMKAGPLAQYTSRPDYNKLPTPTSTAKRTPTYKTTSDTGTGYNPATKVQEGTTAVTTKGTPMIVQAGGGVKVGGTTYSGSASPVGGFGGTGMTAQQLSEKTVADIMTSKGISAREASRYTATLTPITTTTTTTSQIAPSFLNLPDFNKLQTPTTTTTAMPEYVRTSSGQLIPKSQAFSISGEINKAVEYLGGKIGKAIPALDISIPTSYKIVGPISLGIPDLGTVATFGFFSPLMATSTTGTTAIKATSKTVLGDTRTILGERPVSITSGDTTVNIKSATISKTEGSAIIKTEIAGYKAPTYNLAKTTSYEISGGIKGGEGILSLSKGEAVVFPSTKGGIVSKYDIGAISFEKNIGRDIYSGVADVQTSKMGTGVIDRYGNIKLNKVDIPEVVRTTYEVGSKPFAELPSGEIRKVGFLSMEYPYPSQEGMGLLKIKYGPDVTPPRDFFITGKKGQVSVGQIFEQPKPMEIPKPELSFPRTSVSQMALSQIGIEPATSVYTVAKVGIRPYGVTTALGTLTSAVSKVGLKQGGLFNLKTDILTRTATSTKLTTDIFTTTKTTADTLTRTTTGQQFKFSIPTPTIFTPPPTIFTPPTIIPFVGLPTFDFGGTAYKGKGKKYKGKHPTKYTPSYEALVLNITGKAPKGIETGARTRPITKGFKFAYKLPKFKFKL
jgi:hypothetical protein